MVPPFVARTTFYDFSGIIINTVRASLATRNKVTGAHLKHLKDLNHTPSVHGIVSRVPFIPISIGSRYRISHKNLILINNYY